MNSIPIDVIKKANGLENIAFTLINAPECDLEMLESVISVEGFNFSSKDRQRTLLQKAIVRGDLEAFNLVLKYHKNMSISCSDFQAVNYNMAKNKDILNILIKNANQSTIRKALVYNISHWMEPKRLWALEKLKSAVVQKPGGETWNFFDFLDDAALIKSIKLKSLSESWKEEIIKSNFIKKARPGWVGRNAESRMESALVWALLLDDFELARGLLNSGYKVYTPGGENEIEIGLNLGLGYKGVDFLLKNGFSPFLQRDINGYPKNITCENDVIKELAFKPDSKKNGHVSVNHDRLLLVAIKNKQPEIVDLLIDAGLSLSRLLAGVVLPEDRSLVENLMLKKRNIQNSAADSKVAKLAL